MGVARCLGIVCAVAMGIGAFTATQLVMAKDANIQTYQRLGTGKWETGAQIPLHTEPRHLKIGENGRFYADFGYSTNIPFLNIPWGGHYLFLAKPLSSRRFTDNMLTGMILGTVCPGRVSLGRKYCLKGNVTKVEEAGLHAYEPMLGGSFTCILTQQLGLEARACLRKHRGPSGPTTNIAHHCHHPSIGLLV